MPEHEVRRPDRERDERVREDAQAHHARQREDRAEHRPGEPGEKAQRREIAEQQVLRHVEREELLLCDDRDRRRECDHEERQTEGEERDPPSRHRLVAAGKCPCPHAVGDADEDDRCELEQVERPARQQRRLVHAVDCTLGLWAASRRTRPRASRSRRRMRSSSGSARPSNRPVPTGFGAFAGLHPLDGDRFLAASTDSVGTKLILARQRGALRACGADLAAHCINDVSTCGADPLFFLDYVAANRIDLETVADLVEGAAEVCREAGVALVGGETAELPGIYREEELDFAGTCVGLVERSRLIDGSRVEEGDVVVGLPSAGVHANGFTLVRRVLEDEDYAGDDLLAPTRLYLDDVRRLRDRAHALAHVTGGGILGNLERVVPDGLRAEIDWSSWQRPPVFEWLARHVAEDELRRVFNLGIGYLAVMPDPGDELVIGRVVRA